MVFMAGGVEVVELAFFQLGVIERFFGTNTHDANAAIDKVLELGLIDRAAFAQFNVLEIHNHIQDAIHFDGLSLFHF